MSYFRKIFVVLILTAWAVLISGHFEYARIRAEVIDPNEVEESYHGQLGKGTGLGMAEKWCALPNFNFAQDKGVAGWVSRNCDQCHIGAAWDPNKPEVDCLSCHASSNPTDDDDEPTASNCTKVCHKKDTEKRGDFADGHEEVHLEDSDSDHRNCQFCHTTEDHQIAKGRPIDTSEPTARDDQLTCVHCHTANPHTKAAEDDDDIENPDKLDHHCAKVACESCHTDTWDRPGDATLSNVNWSRFNKDTGKPIAQKRATGWKPVYKWYDRKGPSSKYNHMPILGYSERRISSGAKIYPFNVITISWFIRSEDADPNAAIPVRHVKAAAGEAETSNPSLLVTTVDEMRAYKSSPANATPDYPEAYLITEDFNFNISHSIVSTDKAVACDDCHGTSGRQLLDWAKLGYSGDPRKVEVNNNNNNNNNNNDSGCFISSLSF